MLDHDGKAIVGHTTTQTNDGRTITAAGDFSGNDAGDVLDPHRKGFRWQLSVGARVVKERRVMEGQSILINGRLQVGPFHLATESVVREISFAAVGGDEEIEVQIAATAEGYDIVAIDTDIALLQRREHHDPGRE